MTSSFEAHHHLQCCAIDHEIQPGPGIENDSLMCVYYDWGKKSFLLCYSTKENGLPLVLVQGDEN